MHMTNSNTLLDAVLPIASNNPGDTSHVHIVTGWKDIVMLEFIHASVT